MFSPTLTTEVTSAPLYQVSVVWVGELLEKPMPFRWFNPNWCYGVLLVAAVVGFYMLLSHWPPLPCKFVGSFGCCGWLATMGQGSFFDIIFSMRSFTNCSNWTSTKGYCASWSMQWSQRILCCAERLLNKSTLALGPATEQLIDYFLSHHTRNVCGYAGYAACSICFLWSQHCLHAVLPAGMLQVARRRNQFLVLRMARFRFLASRRWQGRRRGPAENSPIFGFFGLLTWETKVISDKAHICRPLSDVVHTTEQS